MKKILSNDVSYPQLLKQIPDPPRSLYCRGQIELLNKTCISIVGTRNFSDYGEEMTQKIIEELAIFDLVIVSGLAKGIDTIAHQSALKNNLPTIAVLGSGIENIYPVENINLALEIEQKGLIISEYPKKTEPRKMNFPQRNRIISGLSLATIVVEAPEKSGALLTADFALEQGREIFVIPGDIDRENSQGILKLLQKGAAYPISSAKEMLEILGKQPSLFKQKDKTKISNEKGTMPSLYNFSELEKTIFEQIPKRRFIDSSKLCTKTSLAINQILSALSLLEIQGLIETKDGKSYRRC